MKYEFSEHARDMLKEREIKEAWIEQTLERPDRKEEREDDTIHYIKAIEEYGGRYLHVVVNPGAESQRIVTLFFNHRLGRKYEA